MNQQGFSVTTNTLMKRLSQTSAFDRFKSRYAEEMNAPTLAAYISGLCKQRGEPAGRVIKRACLDCVYGHQIFSGMRQPTRDKVIQLAFGFEMDAAQTQTLLKIARKAALYPRIERDAAILFCLSRRMGVTEAQCMLDELKLPLLGRESIRE